MGECVRQGVELPRVGSFTQSRSCDGSFMPGGSFVFAVRFRDKAGEW